MIGEVILAIIGVAVLTINCATMILTFPRKFNLLITIGAIFLFTVILFALMFVVEEMNYSYGGLRGLLYLPLIMVLFKGSILQKMYAFFLQMIFTSSLSFLAVSVIRLFINEGSNEYYTILLAVLFPMYAAYITLVIKFGRRLFERLFITSRPVEWLLYSFGALFSFAVLAVSQIAPGSSLQQILILLFILWSFSILCFAIINTHEKSKQRYEADFARSVISSGQEHYQKMNEMHDALGVLRHDYKFHINTIGELTRNGDMVALQQYLTDIEAQIPKGELCYYCSNSVLNALLGSYAERCTKLGISYNVNLAMPDTISIPNYEMCIIFGNLLENAVEACEKIESGREIEVSVKRQGELLAVLVGNSFNGKVIETDGQPVSGKKDGGFGLRSVRAIAERYDGHILTKWDDEAFSVYVMLKL